MKLFLGGARSGKSSKADEVATEHDDVVYLATGVVTDEEMEERVKRHKEDRPDHWITIEEELDLGREFAKLKDEEFSGAVILDCLGFWVSNIIRNIDEDKNLSIEEAVSDKVCSDLRIVQDVDYELLIVSNIVGMGVVPGSPAGRQFRDALGRANQVVAELVDEAYLMVAGMELRLK